MRIRVILPAACVALGACAARPVPAPVPAPDAGSSADAGARDAHRAWWRAFTLGDTARVRALSAPQVVLTMSTGRVLGHAAVLADAGTRGDSSQVRLEWEDEVLQGWTDGAVVTSRFAETVGPARSVYRFVTAMRRDAGGWRVVAAQSTRIPPAVVAVPVPPEQLSAYAGRYRQREGGPVLELAVRDGGLIVRRGDGGVDPLIALSPAVFEAPGQARFVLERDAAGRVATLTILGTRAVTHWSRVP